jgi:citrate lyase subunit beta/citryl-CoA lyase
MNDEGRRWRGGLMRSLLFTPADCAREIEKALTCGADAVILDLEESVAPGAKADARRGACEALAAARADGPKLIVRVHGLASGEIDADLDAIVRHAPYAIMLPKSRGREDVQHLSVKLAVREAQSGLPDGSVRIIPIATESAEALFGLGGYRGASARLAALAWSADDLMVNLGARTSRLPEGGWTPPFMHTRSMALFAAAAAGAQAVDAVFGDVRDLQGLRRECAEARRDGFCGKLAIHPDQVAIINETFMPPQGD